MARVQLELPEQFFYSTDIDVRFTDLNPAGHLGNDQMISLISDARHSFFCHLGLDVTSIDGAVVTVTDLMTTYRAESFAGDKLTFEVGLMDFNKYGADVIFRITKNAGETLVALAKTGFVFVNTEKHQVCEIPETFMDALPSGIASKK
jgi:acyl-CoA thioesterase FadM